MKREICCADCADGWEGYMGMFPGEEVKLVAGTALQNLMCDGCGQIIEANHPAIAVSVSTEASPYYEWEHNYLEIANAPD